jgi:uncharacterized YigZ family protein
MLLSSLFLIGKHLQSRLILRSTLTISAASSHFSYISSWIPDKNVCESLHTIKNSKFLTKVTHVKSFDEAMIFLNANQDLKASHNCWAYRVGEIERCSDDGEPSGTAGRPMLQILKSNNLSQIFVLVTRYFGGIKLGTGGLARAYSEAVESSIKKCALHPIFKTQTVLITCPDESIGSIYQLILQLNSKHSISIPTDVSSTDLSSIQIFPVVEVITHGLINFEDEYAEFIISVHDHILPLLVQALADSTKGKGTLKLQPNTESRQS